MESDNVQAASFQGFLGNSTRGTLTANKRVSVTFDVELGVVVLLELLLPMDLCSRLVV